MNAGLYEERVASYTNENELSQDGEDEQFSANLVRTADSELVF